MVRAYVAKKPTKQEQYCNVLKIWGLERQLNTVGGDKNGAKRLLYEREIEF